MDDVLRSMLFTPADQPRRSEKAFTAGADAVILDLEDAVAPEAKDAARAGLGVALAGTRACAAYVRVNAASTLLCLLDLEAAVHAGADGIMLPKTSGPEEVVAVAWALSQVEARAGRSPSDLIPVIETAAGLSRVARIAGADSRVSRVGFGGGDLTLDLGLSPDASERELEPYRAAVVLASRAAGRGAPLDAVYADIRNAEGLRTRALAARRMGFAGKRCIRPDQVAIVNAAFRPSAAEVAAARRVSAAFEEARADGRGAIAVDGRLVDAPVAERARRIL